MPKNADRERAIAREIIIRQNGIAIKRSYNNFSWIYGRGEASNVRLSRIFNMKAIYKFHWYKLASQLKNPLIY